MKLPRMPTTKKGDPTSAAESGEANKRIRNEVVLPLAISVPEKRAMNERPKTAEAARPAGNQCQTPGLGVPQKLFSVSGGKHQEPHILASGSVASATKAFSRLVVPVLRVSSVAVPTALNLPLDIIPILSERASASSIPS